MHNLIYPVPNPAFPFLGVHFTRGMDGSIHAGPNAVLSMKREGYHKSDFSWRDLSEVMTYPGFWRLSSRYYREGLQEMYRSWSKAAFTRSLQRLVPEVQADDLIPSQNGVRAQALLRDGTTSLFGSCAPLGGIRGVDRKNEFGQSGYTAPHPLQCAARPHRTLRFTGCAPMPVRPMYRTDNREELIQVEVTV